MDWGIINKVFDYLIEKKWTVYFDGTLRADAVYTFSGESAVANIVLDQKEFEDLKELLDQRFLRSDANDGEGWKMCLYSENREIIHQISGYIYGIEHLERIAAMLSELPIVFERYKPERIVVLTDINSPSKSFRKPIYNSIIIGRNGDICLNYDKAVSRRHCEITIREEKFFVKDLGSKNGTYVNDNIVLEETEITAGCILKLGILKMKFEVYSNFVDSFIERPNWMTSFNGMIFYDDNGNKIDNIDDYLLEEMRLWMVRIQLVMGIKL